MKPSPGDGGERGVTPFSHQCSPRELGDLPPRPREETAQLASFLPQLKITTLNIRSILQSPDLAGRERFSKKIKYIKNLLGKTDILNLQETHLGKHDSRTLKLQFPRFRIYYNNSKVGIAGTLVMVHPRVARDYVISPITLDPRTRGRVQALHFRSKLHPNREERALTLLMFTSPRGASPVTSWTSWIA